MATKKSALFCDVCQNRDLNKSAEEYCPQCEEALCPECRENHQISKLSKSHQTISVDKYQKLPSFIKDIKHNCKEHDCFLEFFCKSHDSLCCKLCLISGHKECKETIFIENFLTQSSGNQSAALDNIEKVLKDLESNICSAIKDRHRNLTEFHEQKRVIAEQIKEKRQEINTLLDQLEGELLEKASALEKENCQNIEDVIAKLNEEKNKVDKIHQDIESVKMFASNLQIFIGTKSFQENVSVNEMNVKILYDNGSFNNLKMECTFNEKLEVLIKEIQTFGEMRVNNLEKHTSFSWKADKSAQIYRSISVVTCIENINVRLLRKINIDRKNLTGCAMSETGKMLFLQKHKNKLIKYGPKGEFLSESCIISRRSRIGYDLAMVDTHMVAVSSGGNLPQKIHVIDMNNTQLHQVFNLDDWCYGLSFHNGSFICCTSGEGIKIFDSSRQNFTNFRMQPIASHGTGETYVTSHEKCIFYSNWHDHSVVCYDFSGQVQWKYSDSLLRKPYGITLDSNSNIYVAGSESNNIVVISKDGKQAKELIGAREGISNPHAIHFDKTKNLLLVANYDGLAFLFEVL